MKIFPYASAFAALITAVAGLAFPADVSCGEIGCEALQAAHKRNFLEHPARASRGLTNAELLRRGLPLKYPVLRRGTPTRRTGPSTLPQSDPDTNPPVHQKITYTGVIQVRNADTDAVLGYISPAPTINLVDLQPTSDGALVVDFETYSTGPYNQLNFHTEEFPGTGFSYLGITQAIGVPDTFFGPHLSNYGYIVASTETASGAAPATIVNSYTTSTAVDRAGESAVWAIDPDTDVLTLQWVNPDGSTSALGTYYQQNTFIVGGDRPTIQLIFGTKITSIAFKFIPS